MIRPCVCYKIKLATSNLFIQCVYIHRSDYENDSLSTNRNGHVRCWQMLAVRFQVEFPLFHPVPYRKSNERKGVRFIRLVSKYIYIVHGTVNFRRAVNSNRMKNSIHMPKSTKRSKYIRFACRMFIARGKTKIIIRQ